MRSSSPWKELARRSISSTGLVRRSSSGVGSAGSIASICAISVSSGLKRRWSIHRFVHSVSTIASARIMKSQRWSLAPRSRPAATLAASSVNANSTTFAATIWPMRESSRRVILGLCMDR
jgi:hypothetical protein